MKQYRVIIQPPACAEIEEAYCWLREQAPEAAVRWFNGFHDAIHSLGTHPERFALAEVVPKSCTRD